MSSLQKYDQTLKILWNKAEKGDERFCIINSLLYWKIEDKLASYRPAALQLAHRPGHKERDWTKSQAEGFYSPGMSKDIRRICTKCPQCQKIARKRKTEAPLQPLLVISKPL